MVRFVKFKSGKQTIKVQAGDIKMLRVVEVGDPDSGDGRYEFWIHVGNFDTVYYVSSGEFNHVNEEIDRFQREDKART